MEFNSYQINIILRLLLLIVNCYGVAYLWIAQKYWFTLSNLCLLLLLQVFFFFRYLTRWQRDLKLFADSARHDDFNVSYNLVSERNAYYDLYQMLNYVGQYVRILKGAQAQQNQYFQYLVENIQVGLMAYGEKGELLLANRETLKLLGRKELKNINDLKKTDDRLFNIITGLDINRSTLVNAGSRKELRLSIRVSRILIDGKKVTILSLLNIRSELEATELQSWQELISVLTHEIMNSISPIHSLSGSMTKYLDRINGNEEPVSKARNSLDVIRRRSQSLMSFVDRYRAISTVPLPHTQPVRVATLIESVTDLLSEELKGVEVTVSHHDQIISADFGQVEQILINLLKNSLYATAELPEKKISIGVQEENTGIMIAVSDNGTGIAPELLERIFIPFFTTRPQGSGIGLTLSRQIMQRHGGSIEVMSTPGEGTTFTLVFPKEVHTN